MGASPSPRLSNRLLRRFRSNNERGGGRRQAPWHLGATRRNPDAGGMTTQAWSLPALHGELAVQSGHRPCKALSPHAETVRRHAGARLGTWSFRTLLVGWATLTIPRGRVLAPAPAPLSGRAARRRRGNYPGTSQAARTTWTRRL